MPLKKSDLDVLPALSVGGDQLRNSLKLVTTGWMFGSVWMVAVGGATIMSCGFMAGFSDVHWGLLTAGTFFATLTQIPASKLVEFTGRRKSQFLWMNVISRSMWALVGLAPLILLYTGTKYQSFVAWGILGVILTSRMLEHMAIPAWMSWMADLIPSRIRGGYFGRRGAYCLISQIAASVLLGILFDTVVTKDQHRALTRLELFAGDLPILAWTVAAVFVAGAIFGVVDVLIFKKVRDMLPKKSPKKISLGQVIVTPLKDRQFACFAGAMATLNLGLGMSAPCFALLCQKYYEMDNLQFMIILTVCGPVGQMLSSRLWGNAVDRFGRKPIMWLSFAGASLSVTAWVFIPKSLWYLSAIPASFGGIVWTGIAMAKTSMELNCSDREAGSSYVAANNVIMASAGAAGGLLFSLMSKSFAGFHVTIGSVELVHYHLVLLASGAFRMCSLIWLIFLKDDKQRSRGKVVRRIVDSIYHQAPALLFSPMRVLGRRARFQRNWSKPAEFDNSNSNGADEPIKQTNEHRNRS